jgi:hypothetical protein
LAVLHTLPVPALLRQVVQVLSIPPEELLPEDFLEDLAARATMAVGVVVAQAALLALAVTAQIL